MKHFFMKIFVQVQDFILHQWFTEMDNFPFMSKVNSGVANDCAMKFIVK